MIRSMPFLQSSPHWRKNCRSRKKQNRNQPKHEVPVNHRPMACRDFFCAEFTCILCGVGRNTHILSKISSTYLSISLGTPCLSIPHRLHWTSTPTRSIRTRKLPARLCKAAWRSELSSEKLCPVALRSKSKESKHYHIKMT